MDEQTKRNMIRNYFKPFPRWAIGMIVIGVVFLIGLAPEVGVGAIISGLLIAGIGGIGIYSYGQGKPTDQQMDEWLEEDLKGLSKKSLNKMGIDETELVSESIQITGPRLWDVGGADVFFKKGKDNVLRYTPVSVSIIHFAQNQLLGYTCVFDFTTGNALNESTDEYFYKDVVSVTTRTESKTVSIAKLGTVQLNNAETFVLTTSGGTFLSVLLRDPTLIKKMGGGEIPTTRAEKAIQTVRKMLREKKA
ncbi:MAG: hypothetical protein QXY90_06945 [Candidatus Anstonellales archaeon]